MKHNVRSASPCELARPSDAPPCRGKQPVTNNRRRGVHSSCPPFGGSRSLFKIRIPKSAIRKSCGHRTQEAKPKSKNNHGRSLTNPSSQRRDVARSQRRSFPSQVLDFTLFHSFSPHQIRTKSNLFSVPILFLNPQSELFNHPLLNSSAARPYAAANQPYHMQDRWLLSLALSALAFPAFGAPSADWPQFRGPGGSAVSETAVPPVTFGPSTNVLWKTPLPTGYSSPVVAADRIFVTGDEAGLETLALNRKDG